MSMFTEPLAAPASTPFDGTSFGDALQQLDLETAGARPVRVYAPARGGVGRRCSFLLYPQENPTDGCRLLRPYLEDPVGVEFVDELTAADFVVLPFDGDCLLDQPHVARRDEAAVAFARDLFDAARQSNVGTMIVASGDSAGRMPVRADVVLRHSIDRTVFSAEEHCLPGWFSVGQDPDPDVNVTPSERRDRPVVGFCGRVDREQSLRTRLRTLRMNIRRRWRRAGLGSDDVDSAQLRRESLEAFQRFEAVECRFRIRDRYFETLDDPNAAKNEYADNLRESDYVLCARGVGNYSFRLFDTLAHGRVPVLLDTDSALPFDHALDYRELFPVVPFGEWDQTEKAIAKHYAKFDEITWPQFQRDLRRFFIDWLTPRAFFSRLASIPEVRTRLAER